MSAGVDEAEEPPTAFPPRVGVRSWGEHPGDAAALAAAWRDPAVATWTSVPVDRDVAAAARWIAGRSRREGDGRVFDLVVHPPDDPAEVLGEVGVVLVDAQRRLVEVGYWLLPGARGRGIATSAVLCAVAEARRPPMAARTVVARIAPGNAASWGVVERAGFVLAGRLGDGRDLWRTDRAEQ